MPQAEPELQKQIISRFGTLDDGPVLNHLDDLGYEITHGLIKLRSDQKTLGEVPREDFDCMLFLVHEWDYQVDYRPATGVVEDGQSKSSVSETD